VRGMEAMTCPKCGGTMAERSHDRVTIRQCESCSGVFLDRAELGSLVEGENDWHAHRSTDTAQLPRITADMVASPPSPKARSYVDSLFQG
jgi:Zn-finger nucleic acid-binding protein